MQSTLQPLLMAECLEARLHDQVAVLETILSDLPAAYSDARIHLVAAIAEVNATIDKLKFIARTIDVTASLRSFVQEHHEFPCVEDPVLGHSDESYGADRSFHFYCCLPSR